MLAARPYVVSLASFRDEVEIVLVKPLRADHRAENLFGMIFMSGLVFSNTVGATK